MRQFSWLNLCRTSEIMKKRKNIKDLKQKISILFTSYFIGTLIIDTQNKNYFDINFKSLHEDLFLFIVLAHWSIFSTFCKHK